MGDTTIIRHIIPMIVAINIVLKIEATVAKIQAASYLKSLERGGFFGGARTGSSLMSNEWDGFGMGGGEQRDAVM